MQKNLQAHLHKMMHLIMNELRSQNCWFLNYSYAAALLSNFELTLTKNWLCTCCHLLQSAASYLLFLILMWGTSLLGEQGDFIS